MRGPFRRQGFSRKHQLRQPEMRPGVVTFRGFGELLFSAVEIPIGDGPLCPCYVISLTEGDRKKCSACECDCNGRGDDATVFLSAIANSLLNLAVTVSCGGRL